MVWDRDGWIGRYWRDIVAAITALTILTVLGLAVWAVFGRADEEAATLKLVREQIVADRKLSRFLCDELEEHRIQAELNFRRIHQRLGIPYTAPTRPPSPCPVLPPPIGRPTN